MADRLDQVAAKEARASTGIAKGEEGVFEPAREVARFV
jgi:hypothetical protein